MTIEKARRHVVPKPWGSHDPQPWIAPDDSGAAIGEVWFQRSRVAAPAPSLLMKLLFTSERSSIQVHPDDAFARSIGLAQGKAEAWYIVRATPDAQVALGLKWPLDATQLRASIDDGSIADAVQWRSVARGDVIFVPAGTIHSIGSGLVLAEIQQSSDVTFRLFDYGRNRGLHADESVTAAGQLARPAAQPAPRSLTPTRTLLIASPHFVLERVVLPRETSWELRADRETWLLLLDGSARVGSIAVGAGDALFVHADHACLDVGPEGIVSLVAYAGPDSDAALLRPFEALQ